MYSLLHGCRRCAIAFRVVSSHPTQLQCIYMQIAVRIISTRSQGCPWIARAPTSHQTNPPPPPGAVFRTFRALAVYRARAGPGGSGRPGIGRQFPTALAGQPACLFARRGCRSRIGLDRRFLCVFLGRDRASVQCTNTQHAACAWVLDRRTEAGRCTGGTPHLFHRTP